MNGVTIPTNITITGLKPDFILMNRTSSPQEIPLIELAVPWEYSKGLENSRIGKDQRYKDFSEEIESQDFKFNSLQP